VKKLLGLVAALLAMSTVAMAIPAPSAEHDPHKLSRQELATFLRVICRNGTVSRSGIRCSQLVGYYQNSSQDSDYQLTLDAVAYGNFTARARDEAYLTYTGLEAHVCNFGGGILLRRTNSQWNVVRWECAGQMDKCIALPDSGPQRMLCLDGYAGMGERDSAVTVQSLEDGPLRKKRSLGVLAAQSFADSDELLEKFVCKTLVPQHRDMLLSIDSLSRSAEPGVLAVSKISYAPAADIAQACANNRLQKIKVRRDVVRYRLRNGDVIVEPKRSYARAE
jgi:hypothetical protein